MKINIHSNTRRCDGGALVLTAIILVIVCSVLISYLLMTQNEYAASARSQTWNTSMSLTEAGVEDALAFMNKYSGDVVMASHWSDAASAAADGWTVSGNLYSMHRVVDTNSGYYDVVIDNTISNAPVINCSGSAYYKLTAMAQPATMFATIGVQPGTPTAAVRRVKVTATFSSIFPGAIITRTNIDLNGNNVRVDSFDSTTNASSTWLTNQNYGIYNLAKARANGDVMTDSSVVGAISIGQANIYGHLDTGPGGAATIGNNGYVGPLPQSGSGIQTGYSKDDMNMIFPDVTLPTGANNWQNVPANNIISASGQYMILGLSGSLTIDAPNVTVYVNGNINMSGSSAITATTNCSAVVIYVSGPSIDLHGQATINNQMQKASVLGIYGLSSVTSISFGGNAAFTGTVYAPEADFDFGGGGNNTYDFVGSLVANSCKLNGHANFHYDESLKRNGPGIGYIPASWKELGAPDK